MGLSGRAIQVRVNGDIVESHEDVTIGEILGDELIARDEIVAALINNHLVALDTHVGADASITPISRHDRLGRQTIRRAVTHMLHTAAIKRFPGMRLMVGQSLGGAYYYEVAGNNGFELEEIAEVLTKEIGQLSSADLPFRRRLVSQETAQASLTDPRGKKRELLRAWADPMVPLIELGDFVDIQHGPYPPTTAAVRGAKVFPYSPGLLLSSTDVPYESSPEKERLLWSTSREAREWNRRVGVDTVGDLNLATLEDGIGNVIRVAEGLHEKKIAGIADTIAAQRDKIRVVCISGPSSAGKTTFVRRMSVQLQVEGIRPRVLALDDYYLPREKCPRDANGDYDFEALEALDVAMINEHLEMLQAGKEIQVPRFDFVTGQRRPESEWHKIHLEDGDIVLIEGIHGLNPALTQRLAEDATFRIYINALGAMSVDDHTRMFTSDARLLRRIVRDRRYRGTKAAETIARWPSVRRGEKRHIFPFEGFANAVFNSAIIYETAVLKTFAWRYLLEVPLDHPSRTEAYRLLKLLELFVPLFPDDVPANSVLREFIGGSVFSY